MAWRVRFARCFGPRGLIFGGRAAADRNTISQSRITAIFAEGINIGSQIAGTTYGRGNARKIWRIKGNQGV